MIVDALLFALAVAESPYRPLPAPQAVAAKAPCAKAKVMIRRTPADASASVKEVANLPFAMGRRFRTLDEYLAHLQCRAAPIDLPWWREVRPGIYEHVKRMPGAKPERATRAELIKRFGFSS